MKALQSSTLAFVSLLFGLSALIMPQKAMALSDTHQVYVSNGTYYLKSEPTWVPISASVTFIIPTYRLGDIVKLTENNGQWQAQSIDIATFNSSNPSPVGDGAISYSDLNNDGITDVRVYLGVASGATQLSLYQSSSSQGSFAVNNAVVSLPDAQMIADTIPSHQNVGALPGHAGVSGGSATYTVPIDLPPGRDGMQPKVALQYSSRAGNGLAGVGWSLDATSSISRCGNIATLDGMNTAVTFTNADKLCYGGQRLIAVSGIYGQGGAIYRTEADSFAKIVQTYAMSSGSAYFTVYHKDGRISYFGNTTATRQKPSGISVTSVWALSKTRDPSGNNIIYYYTSFGNGEYKLSSISYTGKGSSVGNRKVQFDYVNRPDQSVMYKNGGLSVKTKLLSSITSYVGSQRVHKYHLNYLPQSQSNSSQRSILEEIQQCGKTDSTCLPATTFNSHTPALSWDNENDMNNTFPIERGDSVQYRDINGDGISELIVVDRQPTSNPNVFDYQVNVFESDPFTGDYTLSKTFDNGYGRLLLTAKAGDLNNNGITDFLTVIGNKLHYVEFDNQLNATTSSALLTMTTHVLPSTVHMSIMDVDSDGYQDILVAVPTGMLHYYKNLDGSGTQFSNAKNLFQLRESYPSTESASPMDINGDGVMDFMLSRTTSSGSEQISGLIGRIEAGALKVSERTSSQMGLPFEHRANQYLFADINGDGLNDFLRGAKSGNTLLWYAQLNKGNGQFAASNSLDTGIGLHEWIQPMEVTAGGVRKVQAHFGGVKALDIDNDGADELVVATGSSDNVCAEVSGFSTNTNEDIHVVSCNDAMHLNYHNNMESSSQIPADMRIYDIRRFDWSIIDFKKVNESIKFNREIVDIVKAPIQTSVLYGGERLIGLQFEDINNDGFADATYSSVSGYSSSNNVTLGNRLLINANTWVRYDVAPPSSGLKVRYNNVADTTRLQDTVYKITTGLDVVTEFDYKPMSRPELTPSGIPFYSVPNIGPNRYINNDPDNEHFYFTSSMYLVSTMSQSNGIGGMNDTHYAYAEAVYNRKGRGFQGFRRIFVDSPSNIRSVTDFHQLFPKTGKVESIRQCVQTSSDPACTNDVIEQMQVDYTKQYTVAGNSNVFWLYPHRSVTSTYDLNTNVRLSEVTNEINSVDSYGNVLSASKSIDTGFGVKNVETVTTYSYNTNSWWINRKTSETVTHSAISGRQNTVSVPSNLDANKRIRTNFAWNTTYRKPSTITVTPLWDVNGGSAVQTTISYNTFGLPETQTISSGAEVPRTTSFTYDSAHYFVTKIDNDYFTESEQAIHPESGLPQWQQDANGNRISTYYDDFHRVIRVVSPGQPDQFTGLQHCYGGCPLRAKFKQVFTQAGAPTQTQYMDKMGRVLKTQRPNYPAGTVTQWQSYDALGRVAFESVPSLNDTYLSTSSSNGTHYLAYDVLGRVLSKRTNVSESNELNVDYNYGAGPFTGFSTEITAGSNIMSRTHNGAGQLMQTNDAENGITRYAYDGAGNPIVIEDANQISITSKYNSLGQKTFVTDPNMGSKSFTYDGFGALKTETDANGNVTTYTYDKLGRTTQRVVSGPNENSNSQFVFDKPSGYAGTCLGTLAYEFKTGESFKRTYKHDSLCRPSEQITRIDERDYSIKSFYDAGYGRVKGTEYPNGVTIGYEYDNVTGHRTQIKNAMNNKVYHTAQSFDAYGNWTTASHRYSSHLVSRTFDKASGQMQSTEMSNGTSTRQKVDYFYDDDYGNLTSQQVAVRVSTSLLTHTESFTYDDLQRLKTSSRSIPGSGSNTVTYNYDAVGNFLSKSDFSMSHAGAYVYGNNSKSAGGQAGPNAVRRVTLRNGSNRYYNYDANGNLLNDGIRHLTYNAMNKPTQITLSSGKKIHPNDPTSTNGGSTQFFYDASHMRYKRVSGANDKSIYIGKLYEEKTVSQGHVEQHVFVEGIAIDITKMTMNQLHHDIRYLHTDRLGSIIGIFDEAGSMVETRAYDPFGKPRTATSQDKFSAILGSTITSRGFTEHEHLDDEQLIHMNGRVYDYNLGRFLSVDPFIQSPSNSQSINPYSYIMNNPLAGIDPSGYLACTGGLEDCYGDTGGNPFVLDSKGNEQGPPEAIVTVEFMSDNGADVVNGNNVNVDDISEVTAIGSQNSIAGNLDSTDQRKNQGSGWGTWDSIQTGLDVVGMIPVVGEVADLANAGISVARGDYEGAALSMAAMVPFVGNTAGAAKIARSADKAIDAIPLNNNSARKLLMARGATSKQASEVVSSFDGQIYATKGKAGDVFTITEAKPGSASGMFVTRGSAGATPAKRIQNLALPMSNTARVQESVTLTRSQVLLEGRVASQVGNRGFGPNATGGGWQVVTDAFNGGVRR